MPKGRSLFSSLPYELKRNIRIQGAQSSIPQPSDVQVKQERIFESASRDGFLPTQPPTPPPVDSEPIDLTEEQPEAGPSKRPLESAPSTPTSDAPRAKKKSRKSRGKEPANDYQGHLWDCTGLVTRYADASEVPKELAKYYAQRLMLFPQYDRLPLLLDETGWFSVTPHAIAAHIADRCQCDVIVDAFCGVGGNAIEFARTCERVIAIDNDPTRLRLARHNALHHGVADRIEFILGDFTEWALSQVRNTAQAAEKVDVVFLSPPWGGPEYMSVSAGSTASDEPPQYPLSAIQPIPGDELFELTAKLTPNIAYFLPRNTDVEELSRLAKRLELPAQDAEGGGQRGREWVEVEEEWVGNGLKAITAYFGGLVSE